MRCFVNRALSVLVPFGSILSLGLSPAFSQIEQDFGIEINRLGGEVTLSVSTRSDIAYELYRSDDLRSWIKVGRPLRGDGTPQVLNGSGMVEPVFFRVGSYTIYAPVELPSSFAEIADFAAPEGAKSEFESIDSTHLKWTITVDDPELNSRIELRTTLSYEVAEDNLNKAEMLWDIEWIIASFLSSGKVLFSGSPEELAAEYEEPGPSHAVFELLFTSPDNGSMSGRLYYTDGSFDVFDDPFEVS